jgi:hypothetical protein
VLPLPQDQRLETRVKGRGPPAQPEGIALDSSYARFHGLRQDDQLIRRSVPSADDAAGIAISVLLMFLAALSDDAQAVQESSVSLASAAPPGSA